jgi:transposase
LRNEANITREGDRVRLKELLGANKRLATVYVLKDDLKQLWNFTCPQQAKQFWRQWRNRAMRSLIAPLRALIDISLPSWFADGVRSSIRL